MRTWGIRLARRWSGLLTLLLTCASVLPPALHAEMDDLACQVGAAGAGGTVRVDDPAAHDTPLHCEVCHWLRSIRVYSVADKPLPPASIPLEAVEPALFSFVDAPRLTGRASRAPPLA